MQNFEIVRTKNNSFRGFHEPVSECSINRKQRCQCISDNLNIPKLF